MYFEPINLHLWSAVMVRFVLILGTVLWLRHSYSCKYFSSGEPLELCFNVLPIEVFLLMIFAQYHFLIAILILLIATGAVIAIKLVLFKYSLDRALSDKQRKMIPVAGKRLCVLSVSLLLVVPGILSVFVYHLEPPQYEAQDALREQIVGEADGAAEEDESENLFDKNQKLLRCFRTSSWEQYTTEECITFLQELVNLETEKLGCPPVKITASKLFPYTLGKYNNETNEMTIDLEHLSTSPVEEVVTTCLHETYHAFQAYVVDNIDWDSDFSKSAFFEQARNWKYNQEHYLHGYLDYDAYTGQDLEKSANEFAGEEWKAILAYIEEE